jgi:hypothetical protein
MRKEVSETELALPHNLRLKRRGRISEVKVIVSADSVAAMIGTVAEGLPGIPDFPPMTEHHGVRGYDVSAVAEWHQSRRLSAALAAHTGVAA